jgi:hypothetical protein
MPAPAHRAWPARLGCLRGRPMLELQRGMHHSALRQRNFSRTTFSQAALPHRPAAPPPGVKHQQRTHAAGRGRRGVMRREAAARGACISCGRPACGGCTPPQMLPPALRRGGVLDPGLARPCSACGAVACRQRALANAPHPPWHARRCRWLAGRGARGWNHHASPPGSFRRVTLLSPLLCAALWRRGCREQVCGFGRRACVRILKLSVGAHPRSVCPVLGFLRSPCHILQQRQQI